MKQYSNPVFTCTHKRQEYVERIEPLTLLSSMQAAKRVHASLLAYKALSMHSWYRFIKSTTARLDGHQVVRCCIASPSPGWKWKLTRPPEAFHIHRGHVGISQASMSFLPPTAPRIDKFRGFRLLSRNSIWHSLTGRQWLRRASMWVQRRLPAPSDKCHRP